MTATPDAGTLAASSAGVAGAFSAGVPDAAPLAPLLVSGTDLVVVALLALACFGLPGVAALLYLRRRASD